jgi:acetyl-CoA decarbonylase/synthase complex subunit delta
MLPDVEVDYAALAPEPDLTIQEEAKKPAPAKKAAPKEEAKPAPEAPKEAPEKAAAKPEPATEAPKPEPPKEAPPSAAPAAGPALGAEELKTIIRDTVKEVVTAMKEDEKAKAETAKKEAKPEPEAAKDDPAKKEAEINAKLEADAREIRSAYEQKKADRAAEPAPDLGLDKKQPEKIDKMIFGLDLIHKRA